ncbi:GFA family protein [Alloalcanivorax marinus]|uniref:GFA family protein n=1 Tax=Alloalcanivorax marinus TaxID=1177169 RepID=UPI0021CE8817|nr:GFA family protein [Alloalcanivorax marinus]MCU5786756.1 glutathione-dependent formaldehyde-activating protein [Alloalcanivorax marinus]
MSTHDGGCLCGKVRYRIHGPFHQFHLCHCSRCRRFSGTAHAANLMAPADSLEWLSGEDLVRRFDLPEAKSFSRAFCSECGSMVPHLSRGSDVAVIPAGGLDQSPDMDPDDHIFWEDRAAWYEPGIGAKKYAGLPGV